MIQSSKHNTGLLTSLSLVDGSPLTPFIELWKSPPPTFCPDSRDMSPSNPFLAWVLPVSQENTVDCLESKLGVIARRSWGGSGASPRFQERGTTVGKSFQDRLVPQSWPLALCHKYHISIIPSCFSLECSQSFSVWSGRQGRIHGFVSSFHTVHWILTMCWALCLFPEFCT